ncbi:hypothetical protein N2152v2_002877 [Parachlorella kessleri]
MRILEHKKKKQKDKDKELLKEAKRFLKEKLKQGDPQAALAAANIASASGNAGDGEPAHAPNVVPITSDDYFARNPEFSVWLRDTRHTYFSELSSDDAHKLFEDFVKAWNAGKLASKFYTGTAARATQRTGFKWSIKGGTGQADQSSLGMAAALADDINLKEEEKAAAKEDRKRQRQDDKEWLDEMLPKATGREALIEKKAARREAAKAREDSPELMRVTGGGDVMGGDDSFAAARARDARLATELKALRRPSNTPDVSDLHIDHQELCYHVAMSDRREARRTDWRSRQAVARQEATQARLAQAQAQEDAKLDKFRALLAQGPLQIAKRQ